MDQSDSVDVPTSGRISHEAPKNRNVMTRADKATLESFDSLPDSALVSVRTAAAVKSCSVPTIWRRMKTGHLSGLKDGNTTRIRVGQLRASMNGVTP